MLVKCSECGKEISNQASACPNCGHPNLTQLVNSPYFFYWFWHPYRHLSFVEVLFYLGAAIVVLYFLARSCT